MLFAFLNRIKTEQGEQRQNETKQRIQPFEKATSQHSGLIFY